jgi:hypothetical protein
MVPPKRRTASTKIFFVKQGKVFADVVVKQASIYQEQQVSELGLAVAVEANDFAIADG